MRVALLTTDNREHFKDYGASTPRFGPAPEALLQGFAELPEIELHVLSCTQRPMQSPQKLTDNIWFHSLVVPRIGWLRTAYQGCVRAVRRKLRALQPDIVHGQGTERECGLCAALCGFPNVVTIHGNMAAQARLFRARIGSYLWLAARLETYALPRTAGVFCHSDYTELLVRPRARRTWPVPNPLRRDFFASLDRHPVDPPLLLCIGTITPRKQPLELLDVIAELHQRGLRFAVQFIGRANPAEPYARAFLNRIQSEPLRAFVSQVDELSILQLIDRFDSAAGLIHFPLEEAFGLVVAEALARGVKLFASRAGGIIDIASNVPGAELISPNDWTGLTNAISAWLSKGRPLAEGGQAIMRERYAPRTVAARHVEIYGEVLSSSS